MNAGQPQRQGHIVAMKPNDTCSAPYLVPGIEETIMIMAIDDIDSPGIFRRKES